MKAVFIELPSFERHRANYLDDDDFRSLQNLLMLQPRLATQFPVPVDCARYVSLTPAVVRANVGAYE